MIQAEIIADSLGPENTRLTTFIVTFPRIVLAEFNTHRMFSRNSASSRAIPFKRMVEMVKENPFIPIAWQKSHRGMQGTEYFTEQEVVELELIEQWLEARDDAVTWASYLHHDGVTKQLTNRLLEPFMWHKVIVTSSRDGLENFFKLRCPQYRDHKGRTFRSKSDLVKEQTTFVQVEYAQYSAIQWLEINKSQAEIHIQALAEAMWDAYNESEPKQLQAGEYHIPFGDNMDEGELSQIVNNLYEVQPSSVGWHQDRIDELKVKVAVARCARISYETLGQDPKIDYEKDLQLYDRLSQSEHWSPFEHVARCMSENEFESFVHSSPYDTPLEFEDGMYYLADYAMDDIHLSVRQGWCRNFRGFIQKRALID